ncbi:MAG TPA: hypothetical protein VIS06_09785, partial [Mycobacteriales bacterium]
MLAALRRHPLRAGAAGMTTLVVLLAGTLLWATRMEGAPGSGAPAADTRPGLGHQAGAASAP